MTGKTSITAKNLARSTANRACANDSAIWMQKDAHWSKSPANPNTPNPFVPVQAAVPQTPSSPSAPAESTQKKP